MEKFRIIYYELDKLKSKMSMKNFQTKKIKKKIRT